MSMPAGNSSRWHSRKTRCRHGASTPPAPAEELLGYYREAEAASGVGWNYLAAINLIETRFGSIDGVSTAGAQGPMQFMPSTFAAYGEGGDIHSPRDSIMAAGRYLAANGFADDRDHALYRYNNANEYVRAVNDYAAILAADPATFGGYYRWNVYYFTTAGDVLLPIGYAETSPIPVADYLGAYVGDIAPTFGCRQSEQFFDGCSPFGATWPRRTSRSRSTPLLHGSSLNTLSRRPTLHRFRSRGRATRGRTGEGSTASPSSTTSRR